MHQIAILGFGTVGSGVAEALSCDRNRIQAALGTEICIKYILDLREFPDHPLGHLVTHDFNDILNDPEVELVAETMGGSHPAYDFSLACLKAGKSVVTSNKEVVASFGPELLEAARQNNVSYLFEASVGGGIPVIRPLINELSVHQVQRISGILNGTTNYILTSMQSHGKDFDSALAEAQKMGYAEANPSADVEGLDAARKIVILAAIAYGRLVSPKDIFCEGITQVKLADLKAAESLGGTIKLIATARQTDQGLLLLVAPHFVPNHSLLSHVEDVFNAVSVRTDVLGEAMFYGAGAGKLPTASAVEADILDIFGGRKANQAALVWERIGRSELTDPDSIRCGWFLSAGEKSCILIDKTREEAVAYGKSIQSGACFRILD